MFEILKFADNINNLTKIRDNLYDNLLVMLRDAKWKERNTATHSYFFPPNESVPNTLVFGFSYDAEYNEDILFNEYIKQFKKITVNNITICYR